VEDKMMGNIWELFGEGGLAFHIETTNQWAAVCENRKASATGT
jgi:hypothetical protein